MFSNRLSRQPTILLIGLRIGLLTGLVLMVQGCTVLKITDTLPKAILNQDDPEVIRDGAPSFLILMDALVEAAPEDSDYLTMAARLYSAYASAFAGTDDVRRKKLAQRAYNYAYRALCEESRPLCTAVDQPFALYEAALRATNRPPDAETLFNFASVWATWLQANASDWKAVAQLPKIKSTMAFVLELDNTHKQGAAHLYMAVLESQLPPALGGKPELAKKYFERAIALSNSKNLYAKVLYAENYARLVYDQALHDRLLDEVIAANPVADNFTLTNSLAQEKAVILRAESADYFE